MQDTVLKIPAKILDNLIGGFVVFADPETSHADLEEGIEGIFEDLCSEWAVICVGPIDDSMPRWCVKGFSDRETLYQWLEDNYGVFEIKEVLNKGKPRQLKMVVKARIK